MSERFFRRDKPPVGGKAKKLWDWFIDQNRDADGCPSVYPDRIYVNTPGWIQRATGTPNYTLECNGVIFEAWNVDEVVKNKFFADWLTRSSNSPVRLDFEYGIMSYQKLIGRFK